MVEEETCRQQRKCQDPHHRPADSRKVLMTCRRDQSAEGVSVDAGMTGRQSRYDTTVHDMF